jgi:GTP pyrophosphokinase/guanosine-3',5'-bis(diphosphate) 3'-pyrophosphohydrolase
VPLWTRLRNGQSVQIITAEGQTPPASWIDIAATGRAKTAIRRSLREVDRERFVNLGRELARVAFENVNKKATDRALSTAAKQMGLPDRSELLARLGSAEITSREVVAVLYPNLKLDATDEVGVERAVVGLELGQNFEHAACCHPLPGERIVGITFRGKGVVVHAINCPNLQSYEEQMGRWLDLHWQDGQHAVIHPVQIMVTIRNGAGVMGHICALIGDQKANISDMKFVERKPDYFKLMVELELRDVSQLHMVLTALEADNDVAEVNRHNDLQLGRENEAFEVE